MHVLSFIPIRHLVKGLARADRFYADMVDRYVRGCVWREMRCEEEGTGNRLIVSLVCQARLQRIVAGAREPR